MMKNFTLFLLLLTAVSGAAAQPTANQTSAAAAAIKPQKGKIESIYTNLAEKSCRTIESPGKGDPWYRGECAGTAGYRLEVVDGNARMSVNVVAPNGGRTELDFDRNISSAFSSLGERAEWRVVREGKKIEPLALIVRFETSAPDDPVNPGNRSYLVVIKIAGASACITDVVKPSKNQNRKARALADKAPGKPCAAPAETRFF